MHQYDTVALTNYRGFKWLDSTGLNSFWIAVCLFVITLPLFFSGFAFSSELRRSGDVAGALSSNLLGAVFGGFLEYASMLFGFQALYVIGGVIYLAAFLTSVRLSRSAH